MPEVDERNLAAMDLTAVMVACDVADELESDVTELLPAFLESRTASLLYDDSLKYWWDGPDVIADLYKQELGRSV